MTSKNAETIYKARVRLREIETNLRDSLEEEIKRKEDKILPKIKEDPKLFYSYAKSKAVIKEDIGPLYNEDKELTDNDDEMANILANQYSRMFSVPATNYRSSQIMDFFPSQDASDEPGPSGTRVGRGGAPTQRLNDIDFSTKDIEDALKELSPDAAPGPDGIPASCYKYGGKGMTEFLFKLLRHSLDQSDVPTILRMALIAPVYKGGERSNPAEYRPIALTSHLCKIIEKVIRKYLVNFLEEMGLIDDAQDGSRPGRSTLSQLLAQQDKILDLLLQGMNVQVLYLDFSKAFDKVDLGLLLGKMKHLGIGGKVGRWIAAFITDRLQAVRVGGAISSWDPVISGVPQGSILGPLLFLIFIKDLGEKEPNKDANNEPNKDATVLKYIDDTKCIKGIRTSEDNDDFQSLLEEMYQWQRSNNMLFNSRKFQLLHLGPNQDLKDESMVFTNELLEVVEPTNQVRDLGIMIDDQLNLWGQRHIALNKVKKKVGWVLRTFKSRSPMFMRQIWKSLIQPHQDYCAQLWYPVRSPGEILAQEGTLQAFTKKVVGLRDTNYWERLRILKMSSSQRRIERYKIIYLWKIIQGMVPNFGISTSTNNPRMGRLIEIPPNKVGRYRYQTLFEASMKIEGARLFNGLPSFVRDLNCPLDKFKSIIYEFLTTIPDQPSTNSLKSTIMGRNMKPSNSLLDWFRVRGVLQWWPREREKVGAEAVLELMTY